VIHLTVNGKPQALEQSLTLSAYLAHKQLEGKMIAIGLNGEVVHRNRWSAVTLNEGDVVDIVQMVGGG